MDFDKVTLEKLQVYQETFIDMYAIAHSLEVQSFISETMNGMVLRLKAYVLAEEVENRTKKVIFSSNVPATWWDSFKEEIFPEWLLKGLPVKYRTIIETRQVRFKKYATYPKANILFPDKVGELVVYKSFIEEI